MNMSTNKNCIIRLSRYKNALYRFKNLGFVKVFSDNLADAVTVTSAQVRKDFSLFGITGNKRGGYQIDSLIERLNTILGKNEINKVVIIGLGNIGQALLNYKGFEKENIKISAVFDIDPAKQKKSADVPILPIEQLKDFVKTNNIYIGVIAVPEIAAQNALDKLIEAGIKGILNFAPIALKAPEQCVLNNVNLELELENVIYFVNAMNK
jgi:redox-sensing transcriptional repressor